MEVRSYILILIVGCGIVTWVPRIVPFAFSKQLRFPKYLSDFLSFIPICILTALFVQSLLVAREGQWPSLNIENSLAAFPTLLVAFFTKNLMWTVIVGMLSMAFLRYML